MVTIRLATEEDVPRIVELYHELAITTSHVELSRSPCPDDYRQAFAQICASPGHELIVAECQGEVVGTVVLLIVPNLSHAACPWALVENLVVDPKHRRQGFGTLLMNHAMARAREAGCFRIALSSNVTRKEAHQFYGSLGFEALAHGFRLYF